jgi:hypothetical protein
VLALLSPPGPGRLPLCASAGYVASASWPPRAECSDTAIRLRLFRARQYSAWRLPRAGW